MPMAFAARTTTLAGSKCSWPSTSIQVGAGGQPRGVRLQPSHARPGDQPRPGGDRLGPVGQVRGRLGALVAALLAGAALDARAAAVVRRGQDRVGLRPPVPAQPVVGAGHLEPARADRQRRQRRILAAGRIGRVAAHPRHAEVAVAALVIRQQFLVGRAASRRRCRRASGRGSRTGASAARRRRR